MATGTSPLRGRVPGAPDAVYAFSGRSTGNVSLVVGRAEPAARPRLTESVGLTAADAVFMRQVHGGAVARVGRAEAGRGARDHAEAVPGVDGLVTTAEDVGLVVLVADCVPLLLAAPRAGVAAVHAGRYGVARNVTGTAVALLGAATGAAPGDLAAVVGPAIGACCYEVPDQLADDIAAAAPAARSETTWGTASLDLPAAVLAQLHAAGVRAVARAGGCTRCDPATWFSHRATTAQQAAAGRQAGIVRRMAGARRAAPPRAGAPASVD